MSILLFIIILAVLIIVHEFGHFIVAKKAGMRVDEFGIGFPPKLFGRRVGETEYTINLFPIGGFVKIFGESPDNSQDGNRYTQNVDPSDVTSKNKGKRFTDKPKRLQAMVLVAGVFFNLLLAWFLISVGFMVGLPTSISATPTGYTLENKALTLTGVYEGSPAAKAGLAVGDVVVSIRAGETLVENPSPDELKNIISENKGKEVKIVYRRGKDAIRETVVTPQEGILEAPAIGITMDEVGVLTLPAYRAVWEGFLLTISLTAASAIGIFEFIIDVIAGKADMSAIAGPVGIVSIVGEASKFGFTYLLLLTALISINLAIINILPIPALDGGRLLFLFIEAIKGSPIRPAIANTVNAVGFALLVILMLVITYNDIVKMIVG